MKLLNNGHPFCRGLVAIVDECPLVRGCGKMSTNPRVWRGQGCLINTKLQSRSLDLLDQQKSELTCKIGHMSDIYHHVYHLDCHEGLFHN